MPESSAQANQPAALGSTRLRFDHRLLTSAEILTGAGALLWVAGWVVGIAALRRAAQDWLEQLDQPPSDFAVGKWQQLLHATTAATNAYRAGSPKVS